MNDPATVLIDFALAKLESENLDTRAALYRALSALTATPIESGRFAELANDGETLAPTHVQTALSLRLPGRTKRTVWP